MHLACGLVHRSQTYLVGANNNGADKNQLAQRRMRAVWLHLEVRPSPMTMLLMMYRFWIRRGMPSQLPVQNGWPHDTPVVQMLDLCNRLLALALS